MSGPVSLEVICAVCGARVGAPCATGTEAAGVAQREALALGTFALAFVDVGVAAACTARALLLDALQRPVEGCAETPAPGCHG